MTLPIPTEPTHQSLIRATMPQVVVCLQRHLLSGRKGLLPLRPVTHQNNINAPVSCLSLRGVVGDNRAAIAHALGG